MRVPIMPASDPFTDDTYEFADFTRASTPDNRDDITTLVFAIMGVTGAGKSTFIRTLTGIEDIPVGHTLESCTKTVTRYTIRLTPTLHIAFLDTPGFDDGLLPETTLLKTLCAFLAAEYRAGTVLSGVLYAHPITADRMSGSARRSLRLFKTLCGPEAFRSVVLVTTKWSLLTDKAKGERFEEELLQKHWGDMVARGARTVRWDDTMEGALAILGMFCRPDPADPDDTPADLEHAPPRPVVLDIQRELVDEEVPLDHTGAGAVLHDALCEEVVLQAREWDSVRAELREAEENSDEDPQEVAALRRVEGEVAARVGRLEGAVREFNVVQEVVAGVVAGVVVLVSAVAAGWYAVRNPEQALSWLGKTVLQVGAGQVWRAGRG